MSRRFTNGVLLAIAGLLAANLLRDDGVARAQSMNGGKSDVFALVAPGNGNGQNVLYVIDPKGQRLAVYDDTARGQLKLRCVRNMSYELQLETWPTPPKKAKAKGLRQTPTVKHMHKLANKP